MPRDRVVEVARANLRGHPAVEAWRRARGGRDPDRVFVLKPEKKRSAVYRLDGVGPDGTAVVAKRGRAARLGTECLIYREVLPNMSIDTLRCYGSIDDPEPGYSWLFLEDAGEERFSSARPEHRALAGRWLALLHMSLPCQPVWQSSLPGRHIEYYRTIVRLAHDTVSRSVANPALTDSDVRSLMAILRSCDRLESQWGAVEEMCGVLPSTLVHGDFGAKNVRVRTQAGGSELLPLDWDSAGWGVAASDLSQADVASYCSIATARWPRLQADVLRQLAAVGRMFLALESITGEVDALSGSWADDVMRKMRAYEAEIAGALEAAGWSAR